MSSKTLRRKGNGTFGGQNAGKSFKIKGKQLPSTSVQRLFSAVYRPDTLNSSKSSGGDTVRVRPPLPAPGKKHCRSSAFFSLQFTAMSFAARNVMRSAPAAADRFCHSIPAAKRHLNDCAAIITAAKQHHHLRSNHNYSEAVSSLAAPRQS